VIASGRPDPLLPRRGIKEMDAVGTAINAAVVAAVGLILAWLGRGRFEAQDRRIQKLEGVIEATRSQLSNAIETTRIELGRSLDTLRSDLTQVALAVGVRGRATNA
jgi:hypothetical protein